MPRPLSDSWQHFDLLPLDGGKNRQAKCRFCGHKQAAGITRLHQHLLFKCTKIAINVRNELKQKEEFRGRGSSHGSIESNTGSSTQPRRTEPNFRAASPNPSSDRSSTSNMTSKNIPEMATSSGNSNFLASTTFPLQSNVRSSQRHSSIPQLLSQQPQSQSNDISQTILDWHLARALFSANIPFDKVDNPHFIEFLKCLQPNYNVPKSSRLKQLLLKEQHWDLISWNESVNDRMRDERPLLQQNISRSNLPSGMVGSDATRNITTVDGPILTDIHQTPELEGSL